MGLRKYAPGQSLFVRFDDGSWGDAARGGERPLWAVPQLTALASWGGLSEAPGCAAHLGCAAQRYSEPRNGSPPLMASPQGRR